MAFLLRTQMSILMISSRKLIIRILKRSCIHVNCSLQIPNLNSRDTNSSTMQQKISGQQEWMRRLITYSTTQSVHQKRIWLSDTSWKSSKMEVSVNFPHTKTITCRIDPNLSAPKTIWQSWKILATKLTSSSFVLEKGWIQIGGSTR